MTKKLRSKVILLIVIEVLCMAALGFFLMNMQTSISIDNQHENTQEKMDDMASVMAAAAETEADNEAAYDSIYKEEAAGLAYIINNDDSFRVSSAGLKDLAALTSEDNIIVADSEGNIIAQAGDTAADFTRARYNQLRTAFETGEPSDAFEVELNGQTRRYYGAKIDSDTELIIEHDPAELYNTQNMTTSWEAVLSKIKVGLNGYTFAVSNQDYTFLYHPDADLIGLDSLDAGLDVASLKDNTFSWMTLNGESLYCGVSEIADDNAYVVFAVPESEITSSRNITVGIVLAVFFIIITTVIVYAYLTMKQRITDGNKNSVIPNDGKLHYDKQIGKKVAALSLVGIVVIFLLSFYMQSLFALSLRSMSNDRQAEELAQTLEDNDEEIERITEQHNESCLTKARIASYVLSGNEGLWTREKLSELSSVLNIEFMMIFDKNGREVVSDSSYINFEISDDPENQSYEFASLLQGNEYVVQEAQPDEISGEYHQYVGVLMTNAEGETDGFVQIAVVPERLEEALASTELDTVLSGVKAGSGGFAFAVNKESGEFSYYPGANVVGKNALEYGMSENQLRDGYSDYINVNGTSLYASCVETDTDYVYVAVPSERLFGLRLPVALASTAFCLVCMVIVYLVITIDRGEKPVQEAKKGEKSDGPMVDVVMPDGRSAKTEAAASRWSSASIKWQERTPGQKVMFLLQVMFSLLALAICIMVLFKDTFFAEGSIFLYVINGQWEKGPNIFALTACIMIICFVVVAMIVIRELLKIIARVVNAKGETICRLIRSFVKYAAVIGIIYYCLSLFGVDTTTLLASAGILTLVVGLGAKTLISDIIAGLFIIFEGEFAVGDIVTIGDWRGTVQEIGVRTTKIVDGGDNVKIISNSDVSGVINMTRRNSYCAIEIGIDYGESLEKVENILKKELPDIKRRLPAIKEGPYYKGVVSLGDNSVNIKIVAKCAEKDRAQLAMDMNRQMKLLFDKYDIDMPFPQIVVNQPKEYEKATKEERREANKFAKSQGELSKGIVGNQDEDKH